MTYDAIVVGLGGVGSAALYHLAASGASVLGIDQFDPPHSRGSSHGQTRVIRQAYFEHPDYVPLLQQAYRLWDELQDAWGQTLFHRTGVMEIGPADGVVVPGVLRSAEQFGLAVDTLSMSEAVRQFPGIRGPSDWRVVLERDAGYLDVERCVDAHLQLARRLGAVTRTGQTMTAWQPHRSGVEVHVGDQHFRADRLVLAAGPWASRWLSRFVPLTVLRKHVYWYRTRDDRYHRQQGFPVFYFETPAGHFYGTPVIDDHGIKVSRHDGGQPVDAAMIDAAHPRDGDDEDACRTFLDQHLPDVLSQRTRHHGCYYTMTPDHDFVIDRLPGDPAVTVVGGLSGHGFKFTSVLGKLAADFTGDQPIPDAARFLGLERFRSSGFATD